MVMGMVMGMGAGFFSSFMFLLNFFGICFVFLPKFSLRLLSLFCQRLLSPCFVSVITLPNDPIAAKETNHGGKYIDQQIGNHGINMQVFFF